LHCEPDDPPEKLTARFYAELKSAGDKLADENDEDSDDAGPVESASFAFAKQMPGLLIATTEVDIPEGESWSFYAFDREQGAWKLRLAVESLDSSDDNVDTDVLPPYTISRLASGSWYAVVAAVDVDSSLMTYRALGPSVNPYSPTTLFTATKTITNAESVKISARPDGFGVAYLGQASLEMVGPRAHLDNYQFEGSAARRIAPLALTPEAFLDEWQALPWEEAMRWTVHPNESMQSWHLKLHDAGGGHTDLLFVQPCPQPGKSQLIYNFDSSEKQTPDEKITFTVLKSGNEFELASVDRKRPAGCPGRAYPKPQPGTIPDVWANAR
jgi:hypothetical protein